MISKKDNGGGMIGSFKRIFAFLYQNNIFYGAALGLIGPVSAILWYKQRVSDMISGPVSFKDTFKLLRYDPAQVTAIITFCLLANAAFFTLFMNGKRERTAIGIFIVTVLFAAIFMTLKLS
jgi:hypothetical protein